MAFPTILGQRESSQTTATSSHAVSRSAGVPGRFVVVLFGYVITGQTITWPAGYAPITGFKNEQTNRCMDAAWHIDSGAESTTITVGTSSNTKSCHLSYSIAGAENATAPAIGTAATATDANPDPPSITPGGGPQDFLFLALFVQGGEEDDDDTWCNNAPSSPAYGALVQKTTGTGGLPTTNAQIASASRQANVTTEDPNTFNTDQSLAWTSQMIAIYPAMNPEETRAGRAMLSVP